MFQKARLFLILSAVIFVSGFGVSAQAQVSPAVRSDSNHAAVATAKYFFKQGETLLRDGKADEARVMFDKAVDSILSASPDVRNLPEVQEYYLELINKIHLLELGAPAGEVAEEESSTPSPLDELAAVDITKEAEQSPVKKTEKLDLTKFDFKFTVTPEVYQFINFYTSGRGRSTMEHGLSRSGRYRAMAEKIFAEEGVPLDLIWLAQVESVWQPSALSWAAAKGIWQFIPGTGRRFGLEQNGWIDERVAPEKATRAAARYLKFLNNYFAGDWLLAMAAYNSGEMNVERAIARCGYADFWELHGRNLLPNETKNYVPAILAVIAVAKDQRKYGFNVTPEPAWKYETFPVDGQIDLAVAADLIGLSTETLKGLNPELKRGVTPPGTFNLKVPAGTAKQFEVAYAELPAEKRLTRPVPAELPEYHPTSSVRTVLVRHKARSGDTLARVASRYGVSVQELARHNRLSSNAQLRKGQVIQVPVAKKSTSKYSVRNARGKHAVKPSRGGHGRRRR